MSWGTELWDQYNSVSDHTQKGVDFCEKFAHFIKERCAVENDYANRLRKLARNYVPKVDRTEKKKEPEFTCMKGFFEMTKELQDLAGQHDSIAESLSKLVLKDLQTTIQEVKQERKRLLADGAKQQGLLQNYFEKLDKAKKHYEKAFRDAEKAQEAYKRAEQDANLSKADVEKYKLTMNAKEQASDDSKSQYALELQKTNQAQQEHYASVMPQIFQQLQDMDEKRINKVQKLIESLTDIERDTMPIMSKCIDGMAAAAHMIDCKQDSQLVIEQYKTGFLPPGDVPFEDLSVTGVSVTAGNSAVKTDTVRGTVTGRTRRRTGLRALFNPARTEEQREDFGNLPPTQQRKQLTSKLESLNSALTKETSERDALLKMQDVYRQNTALGDPASLDAQLEENAQKLDQLQKEVTKYQNFLANVDKNGNVDGSVTSTTEQLTRHGPASATQIVTQYETQTQQNNTQPSVVAGQRVSSYVEQDSFEDEFADLGACVAMYEFIATTDSALSMVEGEHLTVMEADQGDGWTHVRNARGDSGFVPTSYVQFN